MKCVLCAVTVSNDPMETHNAAPLEVGRCCDECNVTRVIPARISGAMGMASYDQNKPNTHEPIGDYIVRTWTECREEVGFEVVFLNWCIQHHFDIVREFVEFDNMMSGD